MSKKIYEYFTKNNNYLGYSDDKFTISKACYTGDLLCIKDNDKIIAEILKTHEKINELIESFNKDTDYKYKEIFETRNNYCNNNDCYTCSYYPFLSCINFEKYINFEMNDAEFNKYLKLTINMINEIKKFINLKLI